MSLSRHLRHLPTLALCIISTAALPACDVDHDLGSDASTLASSSSGEPDADEDEVADSEQGDDSDAEPCGNPAGDMEVTEATEPTEGLLKIGIILLPAPPTARQASGSECGSSPNCQCKSWGSAGGGGYQYGVCSVSCNTSADCPSQTPACVQGKCFDPCVPNNSTSCGQEDAVCITPNGTNSICAFPA